MRKAASTTADSTVRPNQILALGGLPIALIDRHRAARAVQVIEARMAIRVSPAVVRLPAGSATLVRDPDGRTVKLLEKTS